MKKLVISILLLSSFHIFSVDAIKDKYLENYIYDCIEYWFYPNNNYNEINHLTKKICEDIRASHNASFEWNWNSLSFEYSYSHDYVEQLMRGTVIDLIKARSYEIALTMCSAPTANAIAHIVADQALKLSAESIELKGGIFSGLTGSSLKDYVIQVYHWFMGQQTTQSTANYYPSKDCCVCLESFTDVPRVFLTPCGHDICIACAERWFYTDYKSTCPLCRAKVDKKALRETINNTVLQTVYMRH